MAWGVHTVILLGVVVVVVVTYLPMSSYWNAHVVIDVPTTDGRTTVCPFRKVGISEGTMKVHIFGEMNHSLVPNW